VAGNKRWGRWFSFKSSDKNAKRRPAPGVSAPFKVPFDPNVPSLAEMTRAAINILAWDPDGFVLVVEGGAVDWAAHDNNAVRMIEEVLAFSEAIDAATKWVETSSSWSESLIIVTADHETGYLTGPDSGQDGHGPVWRPVLNNGKGKMPGIQWNSHGHTNQLVPLYAKGAGARGLLRYQEGIDPQHGFYIDNTGIGRFISSVLGGNLALSGEPR
jgi:alkaline phosphatase